MHPRLFALFACFISPNLLPAADPPFVFKDVGEKTGLLPAVGGIRGHGVAWGDLDGDGWPDLFVTSFHNEGSKPAMLFRNTKGTFRLDDQKPLAVSGLGSGALFADLTNSGRLDLYVSNCAHGKEGVQAAPSQLFRNDGGGKFTDVSKDCGACPPGYAGRGLAALDFDGDGLLDLVTCEQYYSPKVKTGLALFRNKGKYQFEDVTEKAGIPVGLGGLAVAVGDLNGDTWPDLVLSHGGGEHRVFLNDGKGWFKDDPAAREVLKWKLARPDDTPAGVCIADINRDGLPDIVIGHHTKSPWTTPAPVRLYLNRGVKDGVPKFEDVTARVGLDPLAMRAPHVEIADFDNDGWPDLYVSVVKFKDGAPHPVIFRNRGVTDGLPQFRADAWGVNDFPTRDDKATRQTTQFFAKVLKEKKVMYSAAAPTCDFDRDGRLDIFLANWWVEAPSLLLRNETPGGNYLTVRVDGAAGVNRMGVGSRVRVFTAGKLGDAAALLGSREVAIGYGYCSGQEAVAHFGLGKADAVDVEVTLPHGKGTLTRKGAKAGQMLVVE